MKTTVKKSFPVSHRCMYVSKTKIMNGVRTVINILLKGLFFLKCPKLCYFTHEYAWLRLDIPLIFDKLAKKQNNRGRRPLHNIVPRILIDILHETRNKMMLQMGPCRYLRT